MGRVGKNRAKTIRTRLKRNDCRFIRCARHFCVACISRRRNSSASLAAQALHFSKHNIDYSLEHHLLRACESLSEKFCYIIEINMLNVVTENRATRICSEQCCHPSGIHPDCSDFVRFYPDLQKCEDKNNCIRGKRPTF